MYINLSYNKNIKTVPQTFWTASSSIFHFFITLFKVHDATFAPDTSIILKETLPTLAKAVADGKARYIGLADYDIDLMKEIIEESEVKIASILSYSKSTLFDNRLQNYIKYFKVFIIIMSFKIELMPIEYMYIIINNYYICTNFFFIYA